MITGRPVSADDALPDTAYHGWTTNSDVDFSVTLRSVGAYTLLIAKQDPGQGFVWAAFASLIAGLLITFYLPRRRVWVRISPAGEVRLVGRFDRLGGAVGVPHHGNFSALYLRTYGCSPSITLRS